MLGTCHLKLKADLNSSRVSIKIRGPVAGLAHLYGKIYTLGGHNGLSIFATVECYDIAKGIWLECKPMLTKRCRLGVAALYGKIYACGGYDGSSFLKSVEVYDPVTER